MGHIEDLTPLLDFNYVPTLATKPTVPGQDFLYEEKDPTYLL
jgi:hypothetical protein